MQVGLVLFASSLEHTCQGYDTLGISRHRVISLPEGPASGGPATLAHLSREGPGLGIKSCGHRDHSILLPLHTTQLRSTSPSPRPLRRDMERSGSIKYASPDRDRHAPLTLLGLRGQSSLTLGHMPSQHTLVWTRQHRRVVTAGTTLHRPNST